MRRSGRMVDSLSTFRWHETGCASTGLTCIPKGITMFTGPDGRLPAHLGLRAFSTALSRGISSGGICCCGACRRSRASLRGNLSSSAGRIFASDLRVAPGSWESCRRSSPRGARTSYIKGLGPAFGVGCAIGLLLVIVAVVPIAIWGTLSFRTAFTSFNMARASVCWVF